MRASRGQILRRHPLVLEIRYALVSRVGTLETFQNECCNDYTDRTEIPAPFHEAVARLPLRGLPTFEAARAIALNLFQAVGPGQGLSRDSVSALKAIYAGQGGMCSDLSQVYVGLCLAAGIRVREWGVCSDFIGRKGHAFNEIFSAEHQKWVFLDVSRSIYATHGVTGSPLAVAEIADLVASQKTELIAINYIDNKPNERRDRLNAACYLDPHRIFFLLTNNYIFRQDRFLRWFHFLPLLFQHFLMLICGVYPRFNIYASPNDARQMQHKLRLHRARLWSLFKDLVSVLLRPPRLTEGRL